MDLSKSVSTKEDTEQFSKVSGWASTPALDLQSDIINPKGIDISYFKEHGYVNYEHNQDEVVGFLQIIAMLMLKKDYISKLTYLKITKMLLRC